MLELCAILHLPLRLRRHGRNRRLQMLWVDGGGGGEAEGRRTAVRAVSLAITRAVWALDDKRGSGPPRGRLCPGQIVDSIVDCHELRLIAMVHGSSPRASMRRWSVLWEFA